MYIRHSLHCFRPKLSSQTKHDKFPKGLSNRWGDQLGRRGVGNFCPITFLSLRHIMIQNFIYHPSSRKFTGGTSQIFLGPGLLKGPQNCIFSPFFKRKTKYQYSSCWEKICYNYKEGSTVGVKLGGLLDNGPALHPLFQPREKGNLPSPLKISPPSNLPEWTITQVDNINCNPKCHMLTPSGALRFLNIVLFSFISPPHLSSVL